MFDSYVSLISLYTLTTLEYNISSVPYLHFHLKKFFISQNWMRPTGRNSLMAYISFETKWFVWYNLIIFFFRCVQFFDYVTIEDPRIQEFCGAAAEPSPHAILRTCLLRNFGAGDRHIYIDVYLSYSSPFFILNNHSTVIYVVLTH